MSDKKHDVFASGGSSANPAYLFGAIFMHMAFAAMTVVPELVTGRPQELALESLRKKKRQPEAGDA